MARDVWTFGNSCIVKIVFPCFELDAAMGVTTNCLTPAHPKNPAEMQSWWLQRKSQGSLFICDSVKLPVWN